MGPRNWLFFIAAAGLALAAASWRPGDSSHAMGLLTAGGGKVRHGFHLEAGHGVYSLIATATVLPPVGGDIQVVLEGRPEMDYNIYPSDPVIDLGIHRRPIWKDGVLRQVLPKDRLALWVVMRPRNNGVAAAGDGDGSVLSCCPWGELPEQSSPVGRADAGSTLALAFYQLPDSRPLLKIPIRFGEATGAADDE
jgi:hypothetical protein